MEDLKEKIAHLEEREKSNTHRIDNLEEKIENIHELASSVKLMASEMKAMREDVSDMNNRLKMVEEKPVKSWENLIKTIVTRNCYSSSGIFTSKIWFLGEKI